MEHDIAQLEEQFNAGLASAVDAAGCEALRVAYLGRKSGLNELFGRMAGFSKEDKAYWGKRLNEVKQKWVIAIDARLAGCSAARSFCDVTVPAAVIETGSRHILSSTARDICMIFQHLGFIVSSGNEIEDEWHNFTALNIPLDHPSRDAFDTFYVDTGCGTHVLRSHTSPSQARVMKSRKPPMAVVSLGRVYRPDAVDACHSFMFHQIEGFAVDTTISFAHLKGVLLHFARSYFGAQVAIRMRPHFFPFTEPSAEVDVSCVFCPAHGKCSVCKGKGWIEIMGCGMIHPRVLQQCSIDTKKYRGFAFGMGVERIAMLKYGINDIRLFYENDLRFLEQF